VLFPAINNEFVDFINESFGQQWLCCPLHPKEGLALPREEPQ
jgi:hypothetical protein